MRQQITLHIGEGTSLDGGPFFAAEVVAEGDAGEVVIRHDEGGEQTVTLSFIEESIAEEINRDEPVSISGVPKADAYGSIRVPFREYFYVDALTVVAEPGEVHPDELQDAIDKHGGRLGPNY